MKPCKKVLKALLCAAKKEKNMLMEMLDKKAYKAGEDNAKMKKSTVVTLTLLLATAAGALGMGYYYLMRRQKELEEYEQLLLGEEESACGGCGCGEQTGQETQNTATDEN